MRRPRTNKILSAVPPVLVLKQLFDEIKKQVYLFLKKDKVKSWLLSDDFRHYTEMENTSKDNNIQNNELSVESKVIEATEQSISNYNTMQNNELSVESKVIEATEQSISNYNSMQNNELSVESKVIEATEQSISNYNTVQNGFDILDLESMELVPYFPITISQAGTDLGSPNEELFLLTSDKPEDYGTVCKKRQPKSVPGPKSWGKN